jgi:hypothetical protein
LFKQYKTKECKHCPARALCTISKVNGKVLQRSEFQQYIEDNAARVLENPKAYKKRQALVEHPYGTIERQWGFDHVITKKTKQSASADVGLRFVAYHLTRIWNILRKTNIAILEAYKSFSEIIGLLLSWIKGGYELNSKKQLQENI